jgi:hypothetical protein
MNGAKDAENLEARGHGVGQAMSMSEPETRMSETAVPRPNVLPHVRTDVSESLNSPRRAQAPGHLKAVSAGANIVGSVLESADAHIQLSSPPLQETLAAPDFPPMPAHKPSPVRNRMSHVNTLCRFNAFDRYWWREDDQSQ